MSTPWVTHQCFNRDDTCSGRWKLQDSDRLIGEILGSEIAFWDSQIIPKSRA